MRRTENAGGIVFSSLVLVGTAIFALYAYGTQTDHGQARIPLSASFISANGLARGADVDIAGVKVGRVSGIKLDPESDMAIVSFNVDANLNIPEDSVLSVGSVTLSGEDALMIEPGKSKKMVVAGARLSDTREALSLEQQVSNYIFGAGNLAAE